MIAVVSLTDILMFILTVIVVGYNLIAGALHWMFGDVIERLDHNPYLVPLFFIALMLVGIYERLGKRP